jgi:hypothetical protein
MAAIFSPPNTLSTTSQRTLYNRAGARRGNSRQHAPNPLHPRCPPGKSSPAAPLTPCQALFLAPGSQGTVGVTLTTAAVSTSTVTALLGLKLLLVAGGLSLRRRGRGRRSAGPEVGQGRVKEGRAE